MLIIIFEVLYNSFLFAGETAPVNKEISSTSVDSLNSLNIWFANGFVGVKKSIFEFGCWFNLVIAVKIPIFVFPNPVGKTTKVLLLVQVSRIVSWYNLGLNLSFKHFF